MPFIFLLKADDDDDDDENKDDDGGDVLGLAVGVGVGGAAAVAAAGSYLYFKKRPTSEVGVAKADLVNDGPMQVTVNPMLVQSNQQHQRRIAGMEDGNK